MPRSVKKHSLQDLERRYSDSIEETNFEEVWFAGCHTGAYLLRWMAIPNIRTLP